MQTFNIKGGELLLHPNFLSESESQKLLDQILKSSTWNQDEIQIFGKWHIQPRLTSIYADAGVKYTYSGLTQKTAPWPDYLLSIKQNVEAIAEADFNLVLLNYYRDGNDSMGWHSDDEKELGKNPCIASLSIGAARDFKFRPKKTIEAGPFKINLNNGSLLIMKGETQHNWQHSIAKSKKIHEQRINLTFRKIN
ncbi:MAG: alpha-ketoglutarate-dependent dioxygenase AlkB [Cytophagales bacterium]